MNLTSKEYMEYLVLAAKKIDDNGNYITSLDAITGDGDHYTNMQLGFSKLTENADEFALLSLSECFRKIGMTLMSAIGGSSGALYGSAYISASKVLMDKETIDTPLLLEILSTMLDAIKKRGDADVGMKTMIDALAPAVDVFRDGLTAGIDSSSLFEAVKQAADNGAQSTKDMEAVKGRAYYQANKGVGHIDPGAMTMAYQIETLMDYISEL
ncbi:MAG: dihydroxyacetone kinase subunit DhaL [Oscillospiraceae bacterium]|nr:dihydroxyacetone kinase subunit DhaL [Oscillospiraceae bacterium]